MRKKGEDFQKYVKCLEWFFGICEEFFLRSLGDNGGLRLVGFYFVYMIYFIRIQVIDEWRINISFYFIETGDLK